VAAVERVAEEAGADIPVVAEAGLAVEAAPLAEAVKAVVRAQRAEPAAAEAPVGPARPEEPAAAVEAA